MDTLAVATLNLWNRGGPWERRLGLIRKELAALNPDVIGLQEVLRFHDEDGSSGSDTDQGEEVAAGLGYRSLFGKATDLGGGLWMGNAILTRHTVVDYRLIPLPGDDVGQRRSLLYALIETPVGLLPVFVTHLHWKLHHGHLRLQQVRFVVERVFELAPVDASRLPPVLLGDFNAEPMSDEIRYLRGHATLDGKSVFFADAWVYGGDGTEGHTFDRKNRFAALSHEPPRRIDYIFVRGPDAKLRGEPLSTRLCFTTPEPSDDGPIWPSDHFGLITTLAATPRQP